LNERVNAAWLVLPEYLGQHVILSAAALAIGILISVPLAFAASRSRRLRWPVMALASLVQTIPSLALLALFYPLLLAISALSVRVSGYGFSALGFLPALLALTLYSMLPILRNGVAGIMNIPPDIIEAARGVGMTERQQLNLVELPLAAPVLMAGVRTAAVWVIGAATLSTTVGQTSLGNYIFSGLQIEDWVSVLFGCAAAAALALIVDQLLALIETGVVRRTAWRVALGVVILLGGVAAAVVPNIHSTPQNAYVIGAKNFSEQYILSALMADRLERTGAKVQQRTGLGSVIAFRALASNEIDAYVDYSGTVWANIMGRRDTPPRLQMLDEMRTWLQDERGVQLLGSLGFENAYALAMRRDRAEELGIRTIQDLAAHSPSLQFGTDFEFLARPEWQGLRDAYGLAFANSRQFQPTFMYQALTSGEVDVISAFSSDGRIAAHDLLVLGDPKGAIPPYDAIMLVSPKRVADARLQAALRKLVNRIPIARMREANLMVDRETDKVDPPAAARWLAEKTGLE